MTSSRIDNSQSTIQRLFIVSTGLTSERDPIIASAFAGMPSI
jgi:hypothetical protein